MTPAKNAVSAAAAQMEKSIDSLKAGLAKLRVGRAHPGMLDSVRVEAHGSTMALPKLASVSTPDPRTLLVQPWERELAPKIEKAIRESGLGLNPAAAGASIRVPVPPMSQERREELCRQVRDEAERAKVGVRQARRQANDELKRLAREKLAAEDERKRSEAEAQRLTDQAVADADRLAEAKIREIMAP